MTRHVLYLVLLLVPLLAAPPGLAIPPQEALAPGEAGRVAEIVDGDTLVLADGREIRLVGIQAPKLPLGRAGFKAWPLAGEAKALLAALTLDKTVTPGFGGRRGDRHGRVLAHLFVEGGSGEAAPGGEKLWVQGAILEAGLARVYSFDDNRALIAEMLALERRARAERRGIWADSFYALRPAEAAQRWLGGFELVEGRVVAVGRAGRNTYLNFAEDWRSDFTIVVSRRAGQMFAEQGIDLESYQGRRLRVRGWLKSRNGPMIEATHPEQIELLEE
ncbi:thermonuclease family protein [Pelagibius litoralis]|uniref:Thermonuclease family protein n=1 Tax=Pelagibius litoralis TaxID=374515 RepID=A0A967KBH2_9PROT|nr:thermonuclease family protein [Pelagibius litoralis]NIA71082.1 thermonuclease family protein [Pelagibius litoralis]